MCAFCLALFPFRGGFHFAVPSVRSGLRLFLVAVFFPQYTLKELHSIEARAVPCGHNRKRLHNSFLKTMLGTFAPHTGNLDELRGALDPLWVRTLGQLSLFPPTRGC